MKSQIAKQHISAIAVQRSTTPHHEESKKPQRSTAKPNNVTTFVGGVWTRRSSSAGSGSIETSVIKSCRKTQINNSFGNIAGPQLLARAFSVLLLAAATALPGTAQSWPPIYVSNSIVSSGSTTPYISRYNANGGPPVNEFSVIGGNSVVWGLAVDGPDLFAQWEQGGTTAGVNKYINGSPVPYSVGAMFSADAVAASGPYLFVLRGSGVVGEYLASTGALVNANVADVSFGEGIAVSPESQGTVHLFVTSAIDFAGGNSGTGAVYTCSVSVSNGTGCTPKPLVSDLWYPQGIAVYGNKVFVAIPYGTNQGEIDEYDATTGAEGWRVSGIEGSPFNIAVSVEQNMADPVLLVTLNSSNEVAEYDALTGAVINSPLITAGLNYPIAIAVGGSCVPPPSNMVAWYPFDQTSEVQYDLINGNTAGAYGTSSITGEVSNALLFNGTGSYVQAPAQSWLNMGTEDFSIDAWVKIANSADDSGVVVLLDKRDSWPIQGYHFFLYNGRLGLQLAAKGNYSNYISNTAVPADDQWHLAAVTVERNSHTGGVWYLDGAPIDTAFDPTGQSGSLNSAALLDIGVRQAGLGGGSFFKGGLDELEIFNRALSPAEMLSLMLAGPNGKCKPPQPSWPPQPVI